MLELIRMLVKGLRFKVYGWLLNLPYTVNCKPFTNPVNKKEDVMDYLAGLKSWSWPVLWGIFLFYMHRLMLLRSGPEHGRCGPPEQCGLPLWFTVYGVRFTVKPAGLALQTRRVKNTMSIRKVFVGVIMAIFTFTLCANVFAQENRILMTTGQQYQNMAANADFESWSGGTTTVPDGWSLVLTPTIAQDTTTPRLGSTSLKFTGAGAVNEGVTQTVTVQENTTYTVSFYYKVTSGDSCSIALTDQGDNAFTLSGNTGLNAASWTRKSFTITTGSGDTGLKIKITADADTDVIYVDGMSVSEGHATPAFTAHAITDTGDHTMYGGLTAYGDLTVEGTTNLNGDVNLGDNLSIDTITLRGALVSSGSENVTIAPGGGGKTSITGDLDVSTNLDVDGTITAGSGNNVITTAAGLLDATKLTANYAYNDLAAEEKIAPTSTIVTSENYSSYGDITGVTPGAGLTGGGDSDTVTLNVGAGTGISVTADAVGIAAGGVDTTQLAAGAATKAKLSELRPYAAGAPDSKVYVEAGVVSIDSNTSLSVSAGSVTIPVTAASANLRIDLITVNSSGTLGREAGTEVTSSPSIPAYPTDKLVIAQVAVGPNENAIVVVQPGDITDIRPFLNLGSGSGMSSITGTISETFTIGDDVDADKVLAFEEGGTDQTLTWNNTSTRFDLSSSLNLPNGSDFMINGAQIQASDLSDGANVAHINAAETVTGGWTFNTANTTFTTAVDVNTASTMTGLNIDGGGVLATAGTTRMDASGNLSNIGTISSTGAHTLDGDLAFTGPQAITTSTGDLTLNPGGTINASGDGITNAGALSGVTTIGASGKATFTDTATADGSQVLDINSTGIMASATNKTIASISDNAAHTTTGSIKGLEIAMAGVYNNASADPTALTINLSSITGTTGTEKGIDITMGAAGDSAINTNAKIVANNVTGTTLTDGTASITGGNISGVGEVSTTTLAVSTTSAFTGDISVGGGYASGGITIGSDGTLSIGEDIVQTSGKKYMSDATTFTGDYSVALSTKLGVGTGASADETYLQVSNLGVLSAPGDTTTAVTIADALTQTGSGNLVTFAGNVNANNGLDVAGAALTTSQGLTVSGGTLSLVADSVTDAMVSDTLTASNLVAATAVVSDTEVDNDITIASTKAGSFAGLTTTTLGATGAVDFDNTMDIDKSYTNQTGAVNDHVITRNITLDDATAKTISGNVMTVNAVNTQTSGTLTDNSTLLKLQTGANVGSSAYFVYAANNANTEMFSVDELGNLYTAGTQTIVGGTTYEGAQIIDITDAEALLVRQNEDAGDIFIADTSNSQVEIYNQLGIGMTPSSGIELDVTGDADISATLKVGTSDAFQIAATGAITSDGAIATSGNISTSGSGTIASASTITSASTLTVSANGASITGGVDNNSGGITEAGAISGASTVVASSTITSLSSVGLVPEYDNATPRGDGGNNFGTLTLEYGSSHNYYEWTTSEPTTQDYDIVIRYRLPDGFSSFDASTPIKLWNKVSAAPGSTAVTVTMLDTAGASVTLTGGSSLQNTSWTETTITLDASGKTFSQGGYITLIIKLSADQGKVADVGELALKGNW